MSTPRKLATMNFSPTIVFNNFAIFISSPSWVGCLRSRTNAASNGKNPPVVVLMILKKPWLSHSFGVRLTKYYQPMININHMCCPDLSKSSAPFQIREEKQLQTLVYHNLNTEWKLAHVRQNVNVLVTTIDLGINSTSTPAKS